MNTLTRCTTVLYTRTELKKLHLHFHHPSAGKLYNLLKRTDPDNTDSSVKDVLKQIGKACTNCAKYYSSPFRFRASISPDELVFNMELATDLKWLSDRPFIYIKDTHTLYQTSDFLESKSASSLLDTFIRCWATIFIRYSSRIRVDHETAFGSGEFRRKSSDSVIPLQFSGIESHNSLGVRERYHSTLRRVYNNVRERHPLVPEEIAFAFDNKRI